MSVDDLELVLGETSTRGQVQLEKRYERVGEKEKAKEKAVKVIIPYYGGFKPVGDVISFLYLGLFDGLCWIFTKVVCDNIWLRLSVITCCACN